MKMSPMLGPIVRGKHKQLVLVATVLKHKSNVGTTLIKLCSCYISCVPPIVLVSLFLFR
jgi:hypothetical protein